MSLYNPAGFTQACWLASYGRGAGYALSTCPSNQEKNGALCYPLCSDGYYGNGPVCWKSCPAGYPDGGVFCAKPSSYGRGAGYAAWSKNQCFADNAQGCEKNGAMWYPKCKTGFHAFGCCVCSPDCPDGTIDAGATCTKKSYGRGAGYPMICSSGLDQSGALCYPPCKTYYSGNGPVCWPACPSTNNSCGALCLESLTCAQEVLDLAEQGVELGKDLYDDNCRGAIADALRIAKELVHPDCVLN